MCVGHCRHGDIGGAWAPRSYGASHSVDYLHVTFANVAAPHTHHHLQIYETNHPGAVINVAVYRRDPGTEGDERQHVRHRRAASDPGGSGVVNATVPTPTVTAGGGGGSGGDGGDGGGAEGGEWVTVLNRAPVKLNPPAARIFFVALPPQGFAYSEVHITFDSRQWSSWAEIDAIKLCRGNVEDMVEATQRAEQQVSTRGTRARARASVRTCLPAHVSGGGGGGGGA